MPTLAQIQSGACTSGIGKTSAFVGLLQIIAQLFSTRPNNTPVDPNTPEVSDWLLRVASEGGATPSQNTIDALNTFTTEIDSIISKIVALNCFVPDSRIAALVPLIQNGGYPIWHEDAALGSLTVDGLEGNLSGYLDTGVIPISDFADENSGGLTLYCSSNDAMLAIDFSAIEVLGDKQMTLYFDFAGDTYWDCWDSSTNRVFAPNSLFVGYISANRTSTGQQIYRASSVVPHEVLVAGTNTPQVNQPTIPMFVFGSNIDGLLNSPSGKTFSFAAAHGFLTEAESSLFYTAIQTLRTSLGGGYV